MTARRLNRQQFYDLVASMDREALTTVLWTLYWRGAAPVRERIEGLIEPGRKQAGVETASPAPDAAAVLAEVTQFAALARSGAYLAGDRRVSLKERSRWRHTFRRLAAEAQQALSGADVESAASAIGTLIDLAMETRENDYFRSEDPIEAARFVVSDAVAAIWARFRDAYGAQQMVERATAQLMRWESRYGWTRRGEGWVSEHEVSLAQVLRGFLVTPDLWSAAASHYLDALDRAAPKGTGGRRSRTRRGRAEDLREWNGFLVERLVGSDQEELLSRLADHPEFARR